MPRVFPGGRCLLVGVARWGTVEPNKFFMLTSCFFFCKMLTPTMQGNEVIREELMQHKRVVVSALNDQDISIRRRALDVLYHMCDENSSQDIVSELLEYLKTADFAIREELVSLSFLCALSPSEVFDAPIMFMCPPFFVIVFIIVHFSRRGKAAHHLVCVCVCGYVRVCGGVRM